MTRYRISTAPSEEDRRIALHLTRAVEEVEAAIQVARQVRGRGLGKRVERDLARVLSCLEEVGTIAPRHNGDDPDRISEEQRAKMLREKREQERQAKKVAPQLGGVSDA